jgi:hydroxymethylglutaryl-CoA lyase
VPPRHARTTLTRKVSAMDDASVFIRDVMMRDGLQNLKEFIPTEVKIEVFRMLVASGLRRIEFTSFVSPKAVPQFADASQVARAVMPITPPEVEVSGLIPNLKGAQIALDNGVRRLAFVMSVSESHNISNVRRSTAESIDELKRILALKEQHPDMIVDVGMATVFGCPFEGKISPRVVLQFVRRFYELGIRGMTVADTVGFGNPKDIRVSRRCLCDPSAQYPRLRFGQCVCGLRERNSHPRWRRGRSRGLSFRARGTGEHGDRRPCLYV